MSSTPTAVRREADSLSGPAPSGFFSKPGKRTLPLPRLLVAAVVVIYSGFTRNGFINYDDDTYITLNPHVKAGLTRGTVKWAFTTVDAANYHPLTWISHALDCQFLGPDASAHHEVSALLHAISAVLIFLLLQNVTGFRWRSLFVAALFALIGKALEQGGHSDQARAINERVAKLSPDLAAAQRQAEGLLERK